MPGNDIYKREKIFSAEWANSINADEVLVEESFEACTAPENRIIMSKLGDLQGKTVLDLGCGAGEAAVFFAKKGANVIAVDISIDMLKLVQEVAKKHNVILKTQEASGHNLNFKDETFDIIYAANLLHHVDIKETISEISRLLKKGGIFVSWDPLAYNPLINIYRKIAKDVRTKDEHPIKMADLEKIRKYFRRMNTYTTWFFTLWLFIRYYLINKINPNKEKYWKRIIIDHKKLEKLYYRLERIDSLFLKCLPFMGRFCWNVIIVAMK
jgi:SAM-dependent methyltransferase